MKINRLTLLLLSSLLFVFLSFSTADERFNQALVEGIIENGDCIIKKRVVIQTKNEEGQNIPFQDKLGLYKCNIDYIIKQDLDLKGNTIIIPDNCTLTFKKGLIKNGAVILNNTYLKGAIHFKDCILTGTIKNRTIYTDWFDTDNFDNFSGLITSGNKKVIVRGIYKVSQPVCLKSNTRIVGKDTDLAVLVFNKMSDGEIFITDQVFSSTYDETINKKYYGTSNIEISNLTFDCNRSKVGVSPKEAWVKINDCNNVVIKGLRIISTEEINEYPKAVFINESNNVSVTECYCEIVPLLQMRCCKKMKANNNTGVSQNSTFIELDAGYYGVIKNNHVYKWCGVNDYSIIGSNSSYISIENNHIESISDHGYPLNLGHQYSHLIANNNTVENNVLIGGARGIQVQSGDNIVIRNNVIESFAPIYSLKLTQNIIIENNTLRIKTNNKRLHTGNSIDILVNNGVKFNNNTISSDILSPYTTRIIGNEVQIKKNIVSSQIPTFIDVKGDIIEIKRNYTTNVIITSHE